MSTNKHQNLLHKDLSYQIQGAAIEVRRNFGSGLKETIYQNAFAEELAARNIKFVKEKFIQIYSPKTGKLIGSYRPDFIVNGEVIVELKAMTIIPKLFLDQLYSYLRNSKYELGYFINFASPKLYIKRLIFTNDRKVFLKNLLVSFGFLLVLFSVWLPVAHAATVYWQPVEVSVVVGSKFEVKLLVDTEDDSINTISTTINYPSNLLDLQEINEAGSFISFWVDKPAMKILTSSRQIINMSGIVPGGYRGIGGEIITLNFLATTEGQGTIKLSDGVFLLNDGQGTAAAWQAREFNFTVEPAGSPVTEITPAAVYDNTPPEPFVITVTRDSALFNNQWFIVFSTQDKGSGIHRYEVAEKRGGKLDEFENLNWLRNESPYLLTDQNLNSTIYVKAVDRSGNRRIAILAAPGKLWWQNQIFWGIIIVVAILIFLVIKAHGGGRRPA